jgi:hypothetical protein
MKKSAKKKADKQVKGYWVPPQAKPPKVLHVILSLEGQIMGSFKSSPAAQAFAFAHELVAIYVLDKSERVLRGLRKP